MTTASQKFTGVVLAGGQSRRMGEEKALLDLGGVTMIGRVIEALAPQVGRVVISANGDAARFAQFRLPVVADTVPDLAGPLAGVLAGIRWSAAEAPEATHVLSVAADTPFLPADLAALLHEAVTGESGRMAVASSGGRLHPAVALWPIGIADEIEAALARDERRAHRFVAEADAIEVDFPFASLSGRRVDPFFNANTPDELEEARLLLAERGKAESG